MKKNEAKFSIRMQAETAQKMKYIASYYGRTLNGQLYWLAKLEIERFEREVGPIRPEDLEGFYSGN